MRYDRLTHKYSSKLLTTHKRIQHHTNLLKSNYTMSQSNSIHSHSDIQPRLIQQSCHYNNQLNLWQITDMHGELVQLDGKLSREAALECINLMNKFLTEVFEYGNNWCIIHSACNICSNNVLIHIYIADYYISRQDAQSAKDRIYIAQQCIDSNTLSRDRYYVDAYTKWLSGDINSALHVLEKCLVEYPNDLFAGKKAQILAFLTGNKQRMLSVMTNSHNQSVWYNRTYYHAMLAFALEQNNDEDGAYNAALLGNELHPEKHDVWCIHALAHVYYTTGQSIKGLDMLTKHRPLLDTRMSFLYTHFNFHVCLYLLDLCRFDDIASVYDTYVWNKQLNESNYQSYNSGDVINSDKQDTTDNSIPAEKRYVYDYIWAKQDKTYIEDQFSALNLAWKWYCRLNVHKLINGQSIRNANGALIIIDYIYDRIHDIVQYVKFPIRLPLNLFGLLALNGLCQIDVQNESKQLLSQIHDTVNTISDNNRKLRCQQLLIPYADSLYNSYQPSTTDQRFNICQSLIKAFNRMEYQCIPGRYETTEVIGGSAEQREVLEDFYIMVLLEQAIDTDNIDFVDTLRKYIQHISCVRQDSVYAHDTEKFISNKWPQ